MQHYKMHIHGLGTTMVPGLYISYFGFQTQMKKVNLHFSFEELVCCVYLFNCLHYRTGHSWCCFLKGRHLGPVIACLIWLRQVGLRTSRCSNMLGSHVKGGPEASGAQKKGCLLCELVEWSGIYSPHYALVISRLFFSGSSI